VRTSLPAVGEALVDVVDEGTTTREHPGGSGCAAPPCSRPGADPPTRADLTAPPTPTPAATPTPGSPS